MPHPARLTAFLACAIALACASPAAARQLDIPRPQVMIGVNFAQINFKTANELGVNWRAGFAGGVSIPLTSNPNPAFEVRPEVLYVQKGTSVSNVADENFRIGYLQIGADLRFRPMIINDVLRIVAIPTIGIPLHASVDVNGQHFDIKDDIRVETSIKLGGEVAVVKDKLKVLALVDIPIASRLFKNSESDAVNRSLMILVTPNLARFWD